MGLLLIMLSYVSLLSFYCHVRIMLSPIFIFSESILLKKKKEKKEKFSFVVLRFKKMLRQKLRKKCICRERFETVPYGVYFLPKQMIYVSCDESRHASGL